MSEKTAILKKISNTAPAKLSVDKLKEVKNQHDFYTIKVEWSDGIGDYSVNGIKFDPLKIIGILKANGFFRYDISVSQFIYVHIKNRIAKQVSTQYIKDWFFSFIQTLPVCPKWVKREALSGDDVYYNVKPNDILTAMLNVVDTHFKDSKLAFLNPEIKIEFQTDEKDCKYLYYKNGFIQITAKDIIFNSDYNTLTKHVWRDQILNRDFDQKYLTRNMDGDFSRFCAYISGNEKRLKSLQTLIGYLCHSYFDYKLKAVILTDSRIGIDGESNGRSGKGVLSRGIMNILNNPADDESATMVNINGKDFDFEKAYKYANVKINTKLVHLEDLRAYFNFELLYNDITEGITSERKFHDAVKRNVKFLLSSNKTVKIQGDSSVDRSVIFELSDYFSSTRTPETEFKCWFFREWDQEQWAKYDCFMVNSIKEFFINSSNMLKPDEINLNERTLIDHTGIEFLEFMNFLNFDEWAHENKIESGRLIVGFDEKEKTYDKKDLHIEFLKSFPDQVKRVNQKRFTKYLREYCAHNKYLQNITDADEKRSNGCSYITFRLKPELTPTRKPL